MFTIKFMSNNSIKSESFEKYFDLVKFVARNRIKDEDFVAIDLGEGEIEGLYNFADHVIEKVEEQERRMEELAAMFNEESEYDSDLEEYAY